MATLWRINIKPDSKDILKAQRFCINKNILAVGWEVEKIPKSIEEYKKLSEKKFKNPDEWKELSHKSWATAINAVYGMEEDDLCWTRDLEGNYYLGRIKGSWIYKNGGNYDDHDCHNIRKCEWIKAGNIDSVPGRVITLLARGTVSKVEEAGALIYSQYYYSRHSRHQYKIEKIEKNYMTFFTLIQWDSCEDIVGLYLQSKGYYILPSTCKSGTEKYEFLLRHHKTGRMAAVQVKNSNDDLSIDEYSKFDGEVFLLTTQGKYIGKSCKNVKCLDQNVIYRFALDNRKIMPFKVQLWIDFFADNT